MKKAPKNQGKTILQPAWPTPGSAFYQPGAPYRMALLVIIEEFILRSLKIAQEGAQFGASMKP